MSAMTQPSGTKHCSKCGELKNYSEFYKEPRVKGGLFAACKPCHYLHTVRTRKERPEIQQRYAMSEKRRACITRHNHKRRAEQYAVKNELDAFVFDEAVDLCKRRNKITTYHWHIDHIVPLNHKFACGLHNGLNIQVVPDWWNFKKGNRNMDAFWT